MLIWAIGPGLVAPWLAYMPQLYDGARSASGLAEQEFCECFLSHLEEVEIIGCERHPMNIHWQRPRQLQSLTHKMCLRTARMPQKMNSCAELGKCTSARNAKTTNPLRILQRVVVQTDDVFHQLQWPLSAAHDFVEEAYRTSRAPLVVPK